MLILSIDVGIKNLGFCLANINKENCNNSENKILNIDILDWSIINLLENNICQEIKSCKCNAKFYIMKKDFSNNNYNHYLCNKHSQKYNKNELNKFKNENSNAISLINISNNIILYLNKYFNDLREKKNIAISQISNIIIENQIGPLAIRMKSIQAMITMYFVYNKNNSIDYINSTNKLKYFSEKNITYKERKKKSIEITKNILENNFEISSSKCKFINKLFIEKNEDALILFNKNNKKDDLADCFLQLLYFSMN